MESVVSAVAGTREDQINSASEKMTGWRESADCRPIRVIGWRDKRRV